VRFYVPEWDDAVDANYDFEHDVLSTLERDERELEYIWDIFDRETTPIDGVLISREKVEENRSKTGRLRDHGVYDDPVLSIPPWLPTISDCGAWGYKWLPFPPYGNRGMLEFYADLDVSVGVTIDHLVLGSGKGRGRLYLDERAFGEAVSEDDIPDELAEIVELKIEPWPDEWPPYVTEYEPSIRTGAGASVTPFAADTFDGGPLDILDRLAEDPRAVYRRDDKQFRYDLTLRNAREMFDLYEQGEYSFRLMAAVQGWTPERYVDAAEDVLEMGYQYVGIGGVAGSPVHEVRTITKEVGKTIKQFERTHDTRVDTHAFGFAKAEAFEAIGRSGMSSFDSASMLRAAWTGNGNYRLGDDERYDAIRVRYPPHGADVDTAIEWGLRGREVLVTLRTYDADESIVAALNAWTDRAEQTLTELADYLRTHRHDEVYDASILRTVESAFRDRFTHADELNASFSGDVRREIARLLRADDPDDPLPFDRYQAIIDAASDQLAAYPRVFDRPSSGGADATDFVIEIVREYANWVGDDDLIEEYERTLSTRPWEQCDCPICAEHGIEVAIFRGNDRNRRRGFHNTVRFYEEFTEELPKILVATRATASLMGSGTIDAYLRSHHDAFWQSVHDLPVAEIGTYDANGVHEWWEDRPGEVSLGPDRAADALADRLTRYDDLFLVDERDQFDPALRLVARDRDCTLRRFEDPTALRTALLERLGDGYSVGRDFLPHGPEFATDSDLRVLIIDQCSGSKDVPEAAERFEADTLAKYSKEELLDRPNVPGIEARDLYTGRQQEQIGEAVRLLRRRGVSVDRYHVSAGFGVVDEDEILPPYEVTFSGMRAAEVRERSAQLGIKRDITRLLTETEYDIVFLPLGKRYYRSIDIDQAVRDIPEDSIGVVFNRELAGRQYDNIVSVPARTDDAKRHGTIVIGLKGLYLKNLANNLDTVDSIDPERIAELCRRVETTQTPLTD
jgi:hypothetical protein